MGVGDGGRGYASRDAPIGGQAVLEGVVMRGVSDLGQVAVPQRKPGVEGAESKPRSDQRQLCPAEAVGVAAAGICAGRWSAVWWRLR